MRVNPEALNHALDHAAHLHALLEEEYAKLVAGDLQALEDFANAKVAHVAALQQFDVDLAMAPGSPSLSRLHTLLAACKEANVRNAALVQAKQQHNERLLKLLYHLGTPQDCYQADGSPRHDTPPARYQAKA